MAASRTQARRRARRGAVQAIYQWQVGGGSSAEIRTEFRDRDGMDNVDWAYFDALVDGVIDNAVELDEEHWHWVIDTDLTGTWLGMKTVLPHMLENGAGSIVNISSMAALRGLADLTAYSAAKGGVIGITQQVAQQYGPEGIRVNAIAPGTIKTPILGDVDIDFSVFHIIPRLGEAHEVASMVAFLHSEDAAFLTGHTFPVDGGWNAKT